MSNAIITPTVVVTRRLQHGGAYNCWASLRKTGFIYSVIIHTIWGKFPCVCHWKTHWWGFSDAAVKPIYCSGTSSNYSCKVEQKAQYLPVKCSEVKWKESMLKSSRSTWKSYFCLVCTHKAWVDVTTSSTGVWALQQLLLQSIHRFMWTSDIQRCNTGEGQGGHHGLWGSEDRGKLQRVS